LARGRRRRLKPVKLWKEVPILIGVALVLALLIKTFAVQAYFIPSESMENTIKPGDRVLVNKLSPWFGWEPMRGEVVVFRDPGGWLDPSAVKRDNAVVGGFKKVLSFIGLLPSGSEQDLIKRVVGVPGDDVKCCDVQGRVTVNGVPLDEAAYLFPSDRPSETPPTGFEIKVLPRTVFVLGDHRSDSGDSRVHLTEPTRGLVPYGDLQGHAFVRIWPLGRWGSLDVPGTFHQQALSKALGAAVGAPPLLWGFTAAVPLRVGLARRRRRRSRASPGTDSAVPGVTKRAFGLLGTVRQRGWAGRAMNSEGNGRWTRRLRSGPDRTSRQKGRL
jgi:signal peptidase I